VPAPDAARDDARFTRWDRLMLAGLVLLFVAFGVLVEFRAAFLKRRMTDLGVYLRTAWAVRAGADLYDITDENGWHYQYPPLFAIALAPLADAPPGQDRAGMLPFGVSAAVWYVVNVVFLFLALYLLADSLRLRGPPRWRGQLLPLLACLTPVLHTLMRGQVSLFLLLLLSAFLAALYRGRRGQAGLWLAGAICLKVIPALLLLFPLWKRDMRCLAGCLLGLVLGLAVVPAAVFGWPRTVQYYVEYDRKVLRPGLGDAGEQARAQELTDTVATDSQSLVAMLHNTLHPDRATRPRNASPEVRRLHWLIGAALLLLTLLAPVGRTRLASGRDGVVFLGLLLFNMLLLSPVCHLHYFSLLLPLAAGLTAAWWERQLPRGWQQLFPALLLLQAITGLLPTIPGLEVLRDLGLATYGAFPLWLAGCVLLRQKPSVPAAQGHPAALAA
jgi:alpha-1,2-mannosyltransferase